KPSASASSSKVDLVVSSMASTSPLATCAPLATARLTRRASVSLGLMRGTWTACACAMQALYHFPRGGDDVLHCGQGSFFQVARRRDRRLSRRQAAGGLQAAAEMLSGACHLLCSPTQREGAFLHSQQAPTAL